jgi:hypothetical protein
VKGNGLLDDFAELVEHLTFIKTSTLATRLHSALVINPTEHRQTRSPNRRARDRSAANAWTLVPRLS